MRVLVADDAGVLAAAAAALGGAARFEVRTCADGLEALRIARAWRPHAVVAALRAGRMDGIVLAAALRVRAETTGTRIVLVGPLDAAAEARARTVGVAALLGAPVDATALARALDGADRSDAPPHAVRARRRGHRGLGATRGEPHRAGRR